MSIMEPMRKVLLLLLLMLPTAGRADDPPRERDPIERLLEPQSAVPTAQPETQPPVSLATFTIDPALGFSGPSGVRPRSGSNDEFDTVEDRWRIGFPEWDRYGK